MSLRLEFIAVATSVLSIAPSPVKAAGYWYYCEPAHAYYPYVTSCPVQWREVNPQPLGAVSNPIPAQKPHNVPVQPKAVVQNAPLDGFEPAMTIYLENPLQPSVHGVTNLPDGSELMVSLSRPESRYLGEAKVTVRKNQFITEQFSSAGRPLNPGLYTIEVTMSLATLQPEQVQAVIGKHGERMAGKLAVTKVLPGEKTFDFIKQVQLGGPADAQLDAAARAKAIADLRQWLVASCPDEITWANAVALSKSPRGHLIVGDEKKAAIESCEADARTRSLE